jgi:hypothetical protein
MGPGENRDLYIPTLVRPLPAATLLIPIPYSISITQCVSYHFNLYVVSAGENKYSTLLSVSDIPHSLNLLNITYSPP